MSRRVMRPAMLIAGAFATHAGAYVATVTTSVNGGATAAIEPGGSVVVSVRVAHDGFSFAGIEGGTIVDNDAGVGGNFRWTLPSLPTIHSGGFVGGSRVGASIWFILDPMGTPTAPSQQNPMPVWTYDLSLDEPGEYDVVWVPSASLPSVWVYTGPFAGLPMAAAQTTYVGARITVTPGVGTSWVFAVLGLTGTRQRR